MSGVLTQARYKIALAEICEIDSDLAEVVNAYGPPPIWRRPAGFRTLLYLILEQQVSLASARATYEKLVTRLGAEPDPDSFLGRSLSIVLMWLYNPFSPLYPLGPYGPVSPLSPFIPGYP